MIDVKKLIYGFLILAAAAICSGLVLSFVGGSSGGGTAAQTPNGPQIVGLGSASSTALADSGFAATGESAADATAQLQAQLDTTSTQAQESDPNNITNAFANSFLSGLIVANPNGVQTDSSGNPEFAPPDETSVAQTIADSQAVQDFTPPNWSASAQIKSIQTTPDISSGSVADYSTALNTIFNKYFVSTDLQDTLNTQNSDPAELPYISSQLNGALSDILSTKTPTSLLSFQQSLVRVIVYEQDVVQLAENAGTDPTRASLDVESEQTGYTSAINTLTQQMKGASSLGVSFNNVGIGTKNSSVPFIAHLLGVQPAEAILGVGDIDFDPAVFGEIVLNYADDAILQIMKNTLVTLIQQKVLKWVQGNGAPRFVTNWSDELVNSFQSAAVSKLDSLMACVPPYEAPNLKLLLTTPAVADNNVCASEFNGQLNNNLQNFYNNFTNFNDYLNLFQPGGNSWGLVMQLQDSAIAAGATNQQATQNQDAANQGFKGSSVCDDGSDPMNGEHTVCENPDGPDYTIGANESCDPSDTQVVYANDGLCADGTTPQTTSPGQVTNQSFGAALKSSIENITSADNIVGLLNSLTSSLLNTLAQDAINYSTTAINNGINGTSDSGLLGINPSSITSASTTQSGVQCIPSVQALQLNTSTGEAEAILTAGGGAIDTTCALNNSCPPTENPDGTPIYSWTAPFAYQPAPGTIATGTSFSSVYTATGVYFVNVTASTDNSTSTCQVDVQ